MILNYNGREHLEECLSSALEAAHRYGRCSVIVLDNRSTEPDVEYIRSRFPQVRTETAPANDIVFSYNWLLPRLTEEIVVILNNDMRFDADFIAPLMGHFSDPNVFAVTAQMKNWSGTEITTGQRRAHFKHCWFYKELDLSVQRTCYTLDAGGGCGAFRRERILELGGFDRLFHPGYWEDTDLSYRAWQHGWTVIYEPRSVIYHRTGATFEKLWGGQGRTRLIRRNEVLFSMKNCGGWLFLAGYLLLLPLRALRSFFSNRSLTFGILDALAKTPSALGARIRRREERRVADKVFLNKLRTERPH